MITYRISHLYHAVSELLQGEHGRSSKDRPVCTCSKIGNRISRPRMLLGLPFEPVEFHRFNVNRLLVSLQKDAEVARR